MLFVSYLSTIWQLHNNVGVEFYFFSDKLFNEFAIYAFLRYLYTAKRWHCICILEDEIIHLWHLS